MPFTVRFPDASFHFLPPSRFDRAAPEADGAALLGLVSAVRGGYVSVGVLWMVGGWGRTY